ncbi:S-adenosyl-L-methionine-dependent methyltransferase [Apiospora saccharicola]|uniref:S-adenosyl-L-methionine-dependent methyltransferase n=1 Tax=Apiospora saccharicola TaxID=335842 RepID=A0ABR1U5N6_9PEZI
MENFVPKVGQKIRPSAVEETCLGNLYQRALDADTPSPILGDKYSKLVVSQIEHDFDQSLYPTDPGFIRYLNTRTKKHDEWCQRFLDNHLGENVTILHLACGLDTRCFRVKWGAEVTWIDLDQEDVIGLRQRLLPAPPGKYRNIKSPAYSAGSSITLERRTRKAGDEGHRMISVDVMGSITQSFGFLIPIYSRNHVRYVWATDNAKELLAMEPRLRIAQQVVWAQALGGVARGPQWFGWWTWLLSYWPSFANCSTNVKLEF